MNAQIERCKCGGTAVLESVSGRQRVRCQRCEAVELSFVDADLAVCIWNDSNRAAAIIKSGEGAGDKLREDAP